MASQQPGTTPAIVQFCRFASVRCAVCSVCCIFQVNCVQQSGSSAVFASFRNLFLTLVISFMGNTNHNNQYFQYI